MLADNNKNPTNTTKQNKTNTLPPNKNSNKTNTMSPLMN